MIAQEWVLGSILPRVRQVIDNLRRVAGPAALLPLLAACSSDVSVINVVPKPSDIIRPDWMSFSGHKEEFDLRPPGPQDLVSAEGYCQGTEQGIVHGGIALQMTECDVIRRAGTPERTQVGASAGGEREVVLTYTAGSRPGIYRFARGRLYTIERVEEPEAPPRAKAAASKKRS